MPRHAVLTNRPKIMLDATLPVPLYRQLYERLRGAILAGQLERGARLPSMRTLASELVAKCCFQLCAWATWSHPSNWSSPY